MTMGIFYQPYKDYNLNHTNNLQNKIQIKICRMRKKMRVNGKTMMLEVIRRNNSNGRRELKCKWEHNRNYNFRMRLSMHLRNFWGKNSECIEDWKVSKLVNGMNSKIYLISTIEYFSSSTIIRHIKQLLEIIWREDSHILDFMSRLLFKVSTLQKLFSIHKKCLWSCPSC